MSIDMICVACGRPRSAHANTFGRPCGHQGFILLDSHALDDVPPARRALERARLAQEQHDRRIDVQLRLSSDRASA
jgi:hypothetical protein